MMNKYETKKIKTEFSGISPLRHVTQNDFIGIAGSAIIVNGEGVYVDFQDGAPCVFDFLSGLYVIMGYFTTETLTREECEKFFKDLGYIYGGDLLTKISHDINFGNNDPGVVSIRDCFGYASLGIGEDDIIMSRDVYESYGSFINTVLGGTLNEIEPIPEGALDGLQIDFAVPTLNPKAFKVLCDELLKQYLNQGVDSGFSARTATNPHLEKASALLKKMYNRMHTNKSSLKDLFFKEN